jgi:hypothetical protein
MKKETVKKTAAERKLPKRPNKDLQVKKNVRGGIDFCRKSGEL